MAKMIIDIPDAVIDDIKATYEGLDVVYNAVKFGKVLPDKAKNGDIIQLVYPHYTFEIESFEGFVRCSYDGWYIRLPICWWNDPYKAGDTE